ncbi:MAG TPA: MBL fold metallo-hydrolase [Myxococcota bacterium]|nr:MBL fold metallo-hydrolase [Myxococcota bacterium]
MRLGFYGAVGTVTGSKFLVESGSTRVLVDCGLFQGLKQLRLRNWSAPPFSPERIDAVLLTHAHIDHSGYLPALARAGFTGPVYCTQPTRALCQILLPDSARLQEEDAVYANRKRFSKHHPALPLYTERDAEAALRQLRAVEFGEEIELGALRARFAPAGHILGASSVLVRDVAGALLFSGDLGRSDDLLMPPPAPPCDADWIVMESTYGDRSHAESDPVEAIAAVLRRTLERGGTLLIPSFAVGRAQALLVCLHRAFEKGLAPRVPVFVNSPMATDVSALYASFRAYHRLSPAETDAIGQVARFVRTVEESRELAGRRGPHVVVSASGMATGGRVLHHLRALAPDARNTILLPGFQAIGTRGADLAAGAKWIKIHGEMVPVRAEVAQLGLLSAHADREDLCAWIAAAPRPPRELFLVHGEPGASDALRRTLKATLPREPRIPEYQDAVSL